MPDTLHGVDASEAVNLLNAQLAGSPYSLPDDAEAANRAWLLLSSCKRIEARHLAVERSFANQAQGIRERLDRITGSRAVYESNALELTGLPLKRTEEVIDAAGRDLEKLGEHIASLALQRDRHLLDVLGLHRANLFAERMAADYHEHSTPIREIDIRDLHRFTVPGERFAGSYKEVEVKIEGSTLETSSVIDVRLHMQALAEWANKPDVLPPLAAAVVHSWLAMIHPFQDGNGRVARLLANVVLMKAGWPPLIVQASDRLQYLDALSHSDEAGDLLPLFDLFDKSIALALSGLERPDLALRLYKADLRKDPDLRYDLWWTHLNSFLNHLRDGLRQHGWSMFRMGVPAPSNLLLLEQRNFSGSTWMAKIRGPARQDLLVWLGAMSNDMMDIGSGDHPWPSLFISHRDDRPNPRHKYRRPWEETNLRLDELVVAPPIETNNVLIRYGLTLLRVDAESAAKKVAEEIVARY